METPTVGLTALASVMADVTRRLLSNVKLGIPDIIGVILSDGADIKTAVAHIKELPMEFIDIDSDEGQALSALVKEKLGDQADKTRVDEILGLVFVAVPQLRLNYEVFRDTKSWEAKMDSVGFVLSILGRIYDTISPPKDVIVMEEEDLAKP